MSVNENTVSKPTALKKIAIFGVGLIGGSFALALKQRGVVVEVMGVGRRRETLERAKSLGLIDSIAETTQQAVTGADLILIAAPVAQTGALLSAIAPHLSSETVVTDAGSTKSDVVIAARHALGNKISQFVPAHPIAGREQNGPEAALSGLYVGKKVILTPLQENTPEVITKVANAWRQCGALIHQLDAAEHDAVFAAVSHLPHLLAYALVDDIAARPNADTLFHYAASGFRDFTRIAGSSPEMWRDIALANRAALVNELDSYINQVAHLRELLTQEDSVGIEAIFTRARDARQSWITAIEAAEQPRPHEQGGD